MQKQIILTISPDGSETKVEAVGFVGAECLAATAALEAALGAVADRNIKPEFHQKVQTQGQAVRR